MASATSSLADRALILTLAYGGLRWGESVALRTGKVDILPRRIAIDAAVTEVSGRLVFGEPKTHRRDSSIYPNSFRKCSADTWPTAVTLTAWCGWHQREGPLRYNPYRSGIWDRATVDAGLDGITPHALRHTCASLMRAAGADVATDSSSAGTPLPGGYPECVHPPVRGRLRLRDGPP